MKQSLLFFLLITLFTPIQRILGQDVIFTRKGEEIKSKVVQVGKSEIKYKNFDDPEFITQTFKTSEVTKIRFEDGTEKFFFQSLSHFVGFSFGQAIGISSFGNHDTGNENSGYALPGGAFGLDAGFYLGKKFGIAISAGTFRNQLDTGRFMEGFKNTPARLSFSPEHSKWKSMYFMVGPFYSLKISRKSVFDFRVLVGAISAIKPGFAISYNTMFPTPVNKSNYYRDAEGKGLALGIGAAYRYNFSKRFGLRLATDFLWAKPTFKNEVDVNDFMANSHTVESNVFRSPIQVLRLHIGLVFLMGRK